MVTHQRYWVGLCCVKSWIRHWFCTFKVTFLCLKYTECGPGMYKGKVPTSLDWFCTERDACVPCNGTTKKSVSGDDQALCTEICDGVTNAANADHTTCGKII